MVRKDIEVHDLPDNFSSKTKIFKNYNENSNENDVSSVIGGNINANQQNSAPKSCQIMPNHAKLKKFMPKRKLSIFCPLYFQLKFRDN